MADALTQAIQGLIDCGVSFWNTYDLNQIDELFASGENVAYFRG